MMVEQKVAEQFLHLGCFEARYVLLVSLDAQSPKKLDTYLGHNIPHT